MNVAVKILEKKALKKLGKDKTNTNSDNPYNMKVPIYKGNKIVKWKTQERPIPAGLSQNDAKILRKVRKRAYRWDMGFRCCCLNIRFGWSAIIGLLPLIGDAIDLFMALGLIKNAAKVDGGLPKRLYGMMFTNIMLDFAIGFIPVLGDFADVFYRANTRNAWLLDAYLTEKAKALQAGVVQDPDTGSIVQVPEELQGAEGNRDVETGAMPMTTSNVRGPAPVTPAVTPSRPVRHAPTGDMSGPPQNPSGAPVRKLTPPRAPIGGGLPGRQITPQANKQDPRDNRSRG